MNTHPILSRGITIQGYRDEYLEDSVEYTNFDSGAPLANQIFTLDLRNFKFDMHNVSQSDKDSAMAFWRTNKSIPFWWVNEQEDNTVMSVMYSARPDCRLQDNDNKNLWTLSYSLIQIDETELPSGTATNRFFGGGDMIDVYNLPQGVSIVDEPIWTPAQGMVLTSLVLLVKGTPVGIDNSNTVVLTLKNEGNIVLTRTYNTTNQPPTEDTEDLTGYLIDTYTTFAIGDLMTLSLSQGSIANMPAFSLIPGGYFT